MRVESVMVEDITIPREIDANDLTELEESINQLDIRIPILLTQHNVLVDGLRRLTVFQKHGRLAMPCVRATTLEDSMEWVTKTREHGVAAVELTPRRVYQFHQALREQIWERVLLQRRGKRGSITKKNKNPHKIGASREMMSAALGLSSQSMIEAILAVYVATEKQGPRGEYAQQLVHLVESGEITIYMASRRLAKFTKSEQKDSPGEQEQRQIISGVLLQIQGLNRVLDSFGTPDPALTVAEMALWEQQLRLFTQRIGKVATSLKKEQEGRRNV